MEIIDKTAAPISLALQIIFEGVIIPEQSCSNQIRLIASRTNIKFTRRLLLNIIAPAKINRVNRGF